MAKKTNGDIKPEPIKPEPENEVKNDPFAEVQTFTPKQGEYLRWTKRAATLQLFVGSHDG